MRLVHLIGLLLWRGGLLLAGGWVALEGALFVLRFLDVPGELRLAFALIVAGALLVALSLVAERLMDARAEGDLLK